jgi:hypothetical protein
VTDRASRPMSVCQGQSLPIHRSGWAMPRYITKRLQRHNVASHDHSLCGGWCGGVAGEGAGIRVARIHGRTKYGLSAKEMLRRRNKGSAGQIFGAWVIAFDSCAE